MAEQGNTATKEKKQSKSSNDEPERPNKSAPIVSAYNIREKK